MVNVVLVGQERAAVLAQAMNVDANDIEARHDERSKSHDKCVGHKRVSVGHLIEFQAQEAKEDAQRE